jgi:glucose-6-phosphate dehydrogenase assembly protein OpcA
VAAAIASERHRMGSSATGMVLTLLILSDEESQADATAAAVAAARQHPMRIVTLIPRPGKATRLDAEISVGGDDGPGEVAVLRLRGLLSEHSNSVAIPLLLSDTPVVAYWPGEAPAVPSDDPIGRHAQRRITDTSVASDIARELDTRRAGYKPGDTDLSWTRLTPWRSVLASALDQPPGKVASAGVAAEEGNPSAILLHRQLKVPVDMAVSAGPGITEVRLTTEAGDIVVSRSDGTVAMLSRPAAPDSRVALPRRGLDALLAEELRRLDPDEVYGEVITHEGDT